MQVSQIESYLKDFRQNVNIIQNSGIAPIFGDAHFPSFLGRSLSVMVGVTSSDDETLTRYLNQFPTETTMGERKLLFNFFINFWDGQNDVLEVGPFLGGTSRAIAMGMLHNPNRMDGKKLYTYDKFRDYYRVDQLLEALDPLFKSGVLNDAALKAIKEGNSFKEVYELIHSNQEYTDLIVAQTGILPDNPEQTVDPLDVFSLPEDRRYSAVFVDGAKSWYGTQQFMAQALERTSSGCYYIFQDYGAYTCFWIPVFLELMKDHFKLVANVDHTYVFKQMNDLKAADVAAVFPNSPLDFSRADYREIFQNLYRQAIENDNTYTLMNYQLQHAAALSYIGYKDEARDKIIDLLKTPHALKYKSWILRSLQSPTYTPEGQIIVF